MSYSSRGPGACGGGKPEVAAPIYGTVPYRCGSTDIGNGGGTSGAAPQVAGVSLLGLGAAGSRVEQSVWMEAVKGSAVQFRGEGWNPCTGWGNVDAAGMVKALRQEAPPPALQPLLSESARFAVASIATMGSMTYFMRQF